MSSSTVQTPFPVPSRPDVRPPPELSEKEQAGYDSVLAHFSNPDYVLPGVDTEVGALMEEEHMWLSYECFLRFLRAAKHDPSESVKRLEAALKWRRDFGLYDLVTPEHVEPESSTGSMFLFGYDPHGRPLVYYYPSKQTSGEGQRQLQLIFWIIERAIDFMGPGVESIAFIVDFADKAKAPSFYVSRHILYNLQNHYPERLSVAVIVRSPWLLAAFWRLITPLMDPVTRSKLVFGPFADEQGLWRSAEARDRHRDGGEEEEKEEEEMLATSDQLVSEGLGGSVPFEYVQEVYWPALVAMSESRRKELTRVWRQLGGVVGVKEWDVKVGVRDGLIPPPTVNGNTQASMYRLMHDTPRLSTETCMYYGCKHVNQNNHAFCTLQNLQVMIYKPTQRYEIVIGVISTDE